MTIGNSQVHGYLLSFPDASILESLDELEDYQSDRASHENLYDRRLIEVFDLQGEFLGMAWAYFMELAQVTKFVGIAQPDGLWTQNHEIF
jgi:gamma-glutamylcyclotransferase (GGCT)/AIG2-like uncharacterized protein YtfP